MVGRGGCDHCQDTGACPHGAVLHPIFSMAGIDEEEKGSGAFGYKVPKLGIKKAKCYFKTAG